MGFGKGSTYKEQALIMPSGVYDATITNIEECILKGWAALRIKIKVTGYENFIPNEYTMFAPEDATDEKMRENCEKRMSRFMDATGAKIGAEGLEYKTAIGKKIQIVVAVDKKGFTNISKLLPPVSPDIQGQIF